MWMISFGASCWAGPDKWLPQTQEGLPAKSLNCPRHLQNPCPISPRPVPHEDPCPSRPGAFELSSLVGVRTGGRRSAGLPCWPLPAPVTGDRAGGPGSRFSQAATGRCLCGELGEGTPSPHTRWLQG